jgi:hypothetical protein
MGAPDATPWPPKTTLCGLPAALLLTLAAPILPKVAVGVKVTPRLQVPPAATLDPQLLLTAKSPVVTMLAIAKAALPVLVKVEYFGALVVPMFW